MTAELIAVTGATGRTGGATVRHLVDRGAAVRALTRNPESDSAVSLRSLGVDVVRADMDDPPTLGPALDGASRVFNVQQAFDDRGRYDAREVAQGTAVAEAAAGVGVGHVVQLSAGRGRSTGLAHFDAKLEIRRAFEERGITVTAIHPGPFMELMVDRSFAPPISVWGVEPRIVGWDRPLPWVALDDIGRVAADALLGPVPEGGATVELYGDVRSLRDCRRLLREAGRRVWRVPIPTKLFEMMVGSEFVEMWEWITTIDDELPVTPGLLDVPAWVDRLDA